MRITQGSFRRRYLYDVRLGSRAVRAVYYGGRKIWPTLNDLAERVTVAIPQGLEGAYWHHAIAMLNGNYAFTEIGVQQPFSAYACIAGKWFNLVRWDATLPAFPLAGYEAGTLVLGDNGVPMADVAIGGEVLVQVSIPEHQTNSFESPDENVAVNQLWYTRFLPGTSFLYDHNKGQKRVCPWADGYVQGVKSGKMYFLAERHNHEGHYRADSTGLHWGTPVAYQNQPDYDDDTFRVVLNVWGSSRVKQCYMVFPAFARTFRFKITDIVRHG